MPGHDTPHEAGPSYAVSQFPEAAQVLVVGPPGPGGGLILLRCRLPQARLSVVESSGSMVEACRERLHAKGLLPRCRLLNTTLEEATAKGNGVNARNQPAAERPVRPARLRR